MSLPLKGSGPNGVKDAGRSGRQLDRRVKSRLLLDANGKLGAARMQLLQLLVLRFELAVRIKEQSRLDPPVELPATAPGVLYAVRA